MPITGFTVSTTVFNNSGIDWTDYVFSFEYTQHGANAWEQEYRVDFGPQPVLAGAGLYTVTFNPAFNGPVPEVPAVPRGPLANGATDTFRTTFSIDDKGAFEGTEVYNFLFLAFATRADIHWARVSSSRISDYPEPLAANMPPAPRRILTRFDDGDGPPGNSGPPRSFSNVSVFPNVVPEPYSLTLLGIGAFVLIACRRRREGNDPDTLTSSTSTPDAVLCI